VTAGRARRWRASRRARRWLRLARTVVVAAALVAGTVVATSGRHHVRRPIGGAVAPVAKVSTAAPEPKPASASWVIAENQRLGTPAWRISRRANSGAIEGFADRDSAVAGSPVGLHVSTGSPSFHVEAYRMGWYGGTGARLVWRSTETPGRSQPPPRVDPVTHAVDCPWPANLTVTPDANWPPGDYLLKLVATAGAQHYIPLTVRDDASTAAFAIQNAVTTWQAYNRWGGFSLYAGATKGGGSSFANRARVVSFDRPYDFGDGAADFLGNELPLVELAEARGLDVTYWTDIDLHQRPDLLAHHRALLSLGHDEYWSTAMRVGAEAARGRGVNLAFFGANAVFRHIRFAPSPLGPDRHEIAYKSASEDPLRASQPAEVTVNWRDPPVNRPENALLGEEYECNPTKADMAFVDLGNWVLAGTGLRAGDQVANVVGPEYDRYVPTPTAPSGVEIVAHSPLRCHGHPSYSDMTYASFPSGAGVWDTGTNWWIATLMAPCATNPCPAATLTRITLNVLAAFGAGPAGAVHRSVANYQSLPHGRAPVSHPPREQSPRITPPSSSSTRPAQRA
jgi:hypothetical protein